MNLFALPSHVEWIIFTAIFISIGLFIVTAEFLRQHFNGSPEITRKLVHILTGVLIFFAPIIFVSGIPAILLASAFIVINFTAVQFGLLKGMHGTSRHSYGTVYYPLSFLLLVLLFWDSMPGVISISILVLAFADAAAAIVGENLKSAHYFALTSDKKSFEGSFVMLLTAFITVIAGIQYFYPHINFYDSIFISLAIAVFVTAWEAISSRGFDNLTIPMSASLMLHYFLTVSPESFQQMYIGIILSIGIGSVSWYFKFLTPNGSVATFLLATIIFGLGGVVWTVPILTFFIASSLLSKIGKSRKKNSIVILDKTDVRDAGQVAANGGIAGIITIIWHFFPNQSELLLCYLAAIASVTADTWGTEIGTLFKGKPRSIINLKKVESGTSGGVSLAGLLGGIVGAALIVFSASTLFNDVLSWKIFLTIVIAGCIGSLVDSVVGALFQVQYKNDSGGITEKQFDDGKPTHYFRGIKWVNNDVVNWICAASGVIAFLLIQ